MGKMLFSSTGKAERMIGVKSEIKVGQQFESAIPADVTRVAHGNWTSRTVFVWDPSSNRMIDVERDTRTIDYF